MPSLITEPLLSLALVDLRSASVIAISDLSSYFGAIPTSNNVGLQITPPGYPTIGVTFTPGQVNIYKCADLGITCSDVNCCPLPDGIWDVRYRVRHSPTSTGARATEINQKFIKVDNIKCKFQRAFLKVDMECGCEDDEQRKLKDQLRRIKLLIDGSVAEANNSNYKISHAYYQRAEKMLDQLACRFPTLKETSCGC